MRNKIKSLLIAVFILLTLLYPSKILPNQMQASIANAGVNLGCLSAYIPRMGITPANSAQINNWINIVDRELQTIISLYRSPFNSETLSRILNSLRRFNITTARWNIQQRGAFFHNIYGQLKQQFSLIFRSDRGIFYSATCDSFTLDFGYQFGRAWIGAWLMDRTLFSGARSSMFLAINEGIRCSNNLGCSFPYRNTWDSLNLRLVDTNQEFRDIFGRALGIITGLRGSNSANGFPSSPGTSSTPPVRSGLIGRWSLGGQIMEFRRTNTGISGYTVSAGGEYQANEEVYIINRISGNTYYGRAKGKAPNGSVTWVNITIKVSGNSGTVSSSASRVGSMRIIRVN